MIERTKVIVIGLDCAEPSLVFDQWLNDLPNIKKVLDSGVHACMRSSDPPIPIPAWASMMTGKDPGQLGIYGFRNRNSYKYNDIRIVDSTLLTEPTVWDILGKHGYQSIIIGFPPSYPPKPIKGHLISCFLTPDRQVTYTYPESLQTEIENEVGGYQFDITNFQTSNKDELIANLYQMSKKRFETARYLIQKKPWDLFMMVETGIDRVHHAFWNFMDEKHIRYQPFSPYKDTIYKYYKFVDQEIGTILDLAPPNCGIFIVSNHGATRLKGGFCINEWLIQEEYLKLKRSVNEPTILKEDMVDWNNTKAWGYGGYYGRLCINVKGREPQGTILKEKYEPFRNLLIKKLKALTDEEGRPLDSIVYKPSKRYTKIKNIPPDLIVYFGQLYWCSVPTIGTGRLHAFENDMGPGEANHNYDGIFIYSNNLDNEGGQKLSRFQLMDIAPTILQHFGISPLKGMQGKLIPIF